MWTGMRIVRDWSARPRWIAWRIHHVAYVENLKPRCHSNLSTARIRPALPSWMRSRKPRPRFMYFLALATTSRRFADVRWSRADAGREDTEAPSIISATDRRTSSWPASIQRRIAGIATSSRAQVAHRHERLSRRGPPAAAVAVDPVEQRHERLGVEPLVVDGAEVAGPLEQLARPRPRPTRSPRSGRSAGP